MTARLLCAVFTAAIATSAFAQSIVGFDDGHAALYEDEGTVQFTVVRTGSLTGTASVDYQTTGGDAIANVDYLPLSGTLHFGNGESQKTITVTVIDNNVTDPKPHRLVGLLLDNFVHCEGYSYGYPYYMATVEIKDDEPLAPPLTLSVNSSLTFSEGDGVTNTSLTFSLNRPHDQLVWFTFRYVPRPDATAGVSIEGVRFEPGETTKQVPLTITGNNVYDGNGSSNYHFMPILATWDPVVAEPFEITITDDDAIATVSISDISVPEGSCGPTPIEITLTADAPVNGLVYWTMSDGTGTQAGIDYGPNGVNEPVHMVTTTTAKITAVAPYGDLTIEEDETFFVTLTSATNMNIGDDTATITIENDDEELPSFAEELVRIEAGEQSTLTINFPAPAPEGTVLLSSSDPRLQVPPSVDVPERATSVTFTAQATEAIGRVTVTADLPGRLGATHVSATVDAFRDSDLRFEGPRRVAFAGETALASIALDPPREEEATITLAASAGIVVPESAIVPPGGTAEFPFTSLAAGPGWISATYGEHSQQLVIDIAAQELKAFAPESAPAAGGTPVTVKGLGFSPGCTASFGTVAAQTTFVDAQTLIAKTPAHAADSVNVIVTCGVTLATISTQFRFANPKRRATRH